MTRRTSISIRTTVSQAMGICVCVLVSACSQSHTTQQQAMQQQVMQQQAMQQQTAQPQKIIAVSPLPVKHFMVMKSAKPSPSVAPQVVATLVPAVRPIPQASVALAPPTSQSVVLRSPHAAPAIVRVNIPSLSVSSGQTVRATVYTTSNTASVEARLYGYGMPLQRVGVGQFRLVYQVPAIPAYLKRTWPVRVIARNVDGVSASKQLMIDVH